MPIPSVPKIKRSSGILYTAPIIFTNMFDTAIINAPATKLFFLSVNCQSSLSSLVFAVSVPYKDVMLIVQKVFIKLVCNCYGAVFSARAAYADYKL